MVKGVQRQGGAVCVRDTWNLPEGQVPSFENQLFSKYTRASTLKTPGCPAPHRTITLQKQVASAPWWLFLPSRVNPIPSKKTTTAFSQQPQEGPREL